MYSIVEHPGMSIMKLAMINALGLNGGILLFCLLVDKSLFAEHRDKLHGTVSTFQEVDEKIKGID